jgi:hypothetical protein
LKSISAMFLLAALATPVTAQQPRPSTTRMTCAQASGLVASSGAIVLATGPLTYDRFVAHAGHCPLGQFAQPIWVPTLDTPQCPIGSVCRDRSQRLR